MNSTPIQAERKETPPPPPPPTFGRADFLNALAPPEVGTPTRRKTGDDAGLPIETPADLRELEDEIADGETQWLSPLMQEGAVAFVSEFTPEVGVHDEWRSFTLIPTVVLARDNSLLCAWALTEATTDFAAVDAIAQGMGATRDADLIFPGCDGWELVHCDHEAAYTLDALTEVYCDKPQQIAHTPATTVQPLARILDADVFRPIDLEHDPRFDREISLALANSSRSKEWSTHKMPLRHGLARFLQHRETRRKDGKAVMLGALDGLARTADAVVSLDLIGLDIDVGMSGDELRHRIADSGLLVVAYTTFSHLKTETRISVGAFNTAACDAGEVTDEAARAVLKAKAIVPEIADHASAKVEGDEVVITHPPIEKWRVIGVLSEPFVVTDYASVYAASEAWKRVIQAFADALGGIPYDRACSDLNRLFLEPSHEPEKDWNISLFGGEFFDLKTALETGRLPPPSPRAKRSGSADHVISAGGDPEWRRWAAQRADGFQIADMFTDLAPAGVVRKQSGEKLTVECPNDAQHNNAGDRGDPGCYVENAGDRGFRFSCRHDACAHLDRLDLLRMAIEAGWFTAEDVQGDNYDALDRSHEEPPAGKEMDAARVEYQALIDGLTRESSDEEIDQAVSAIIQANLSEVAHDRAEQALAEKLGLKPTKARQLVSRVRRQVTAPQDGVVIQDDGRRILQFQGGHPDHIKARNFLVGVMQAANQAEPVFTSNLGALFHMERHGGKVAFEAVETPAQLRGKLGLHCSFVRLSGETNTPGAPKAPLLDICSDLLHSIRPGEVLEQPMIRRAPTIAADGTLLDRDGLHGNVYVDLGGLNVPPIPKCPSEDDVVAARRVVMEEVLGDFRFYDKGDDTGAASRANAAAMLLTPFMRDQFSGPAPVFGAMKPQAAAGGSLVCKASQILLDGKETAPTPYTGNEEEMQKTLVATVQAGQSHLFFDNVTHFNSQAVLKSTTAEMVGGRVLGLSQMIERPNHFVWQFSGNNPRLGAEMRRRTVFINLNADAAANAGEDFSHPIFEEWLAENRGRVIAALLTLIRAWFVAEKPAPKAGEPFKSFEGWRKAVGGVLAHAGVEGLLSNRPAERADRESSELADFAEAWLRRHTFEPVKVSAAFSWAAGIASPLASQGFDDAEKRAAFEEKLDGLNGRTFAIDGARLMLDRNDETGEWSMVKLRDLPVPKTPPEPS